MTDPVPLRLQIIVYALVAASFTTHYATQPVLQAEFGADPPRVSLTVSAVIRDVALASLPFGLPTDRVRSNRPAERGPQSVRVTGAGAAA